jgi:putative copper export protein
MLLKILVLVHVLGACIWVGGHLILALSVLPEAFRKKDYKVVLEFEKRFERIGIPALMLQVVSGLWMASIYLPVNEWLAFSDRVHIHIGIKLILLLLTAILAIHARLFIIPELSNANLSVLAGHIFIITAIAVSLLFVGLNFRLAFM